MAKKRKPRKSSIHRGQSLLIREYAKKLAREISRQRKPNPRRKRNALSVGLPRNKWVNARVRITGDGKIQAQVGENVLGALLGKKKNRRKVNRRKKR